MSSPEWDGNSCPEWEAQAAVAEAARPPAPERRINLDRAAAEAGISRRTLYNWLALGRITAVRAGTSQLVLLSEVRTIRQQPRPGRGPRR